MKAKQIIKNEYYTPHKYVELARKVMGSIDLDPMSCEKANLVVKAARFFDINIDAFKQSWECGTMFFNPPYSEGMFGPSVDKFMLELDKIGMAIMLTNINTDTKKGNMLIKNCDAICLPDHRIHFLDERLIRQTNNRYSQIFYLFNNSIDPIVSLKFAQKFQKIGEVFIK